MQNNLYLLDADMMVCETTVLQVSKAATGCELALLDNITRPASGGEPSDRGVLKVLGEQFVFDSVVKKDGLTWIQVPGAELPPAINDGVRVELDADYRVRRRRLHTGVHVVIRSFLTVADIAVTGADIDNEANSATITGALVKPIDDALIVDVTRRVSQVVASAIPVVALKAKSIDHARQLYGAQFRMSDRHALSGKVRLIKIGDFDVNPCSGLHWNDTDIGPYSLRISFVSDAFEAVLEIAGPG